MFLDRKKVAVFASKVESDSYEEDSEDDSTSESSDNKSDSSDSSNYDPRSDKSLHSESDLSLAELNKVVRSNTKRIQALEDVNADFKRKREDREKERQERMGSGYSDRSSRPPFRSRPYEGRDSSSSFGSRPSYGDKGGRFGDRGGDRGGDRDRSRPSFGSRDGGGFGGGDRDRSRPSFGSRDGGGFGGGSSSFSSGGQGGVVKSTRERTDGRSSSRFDIFNKDEQ